MPGGVRGRGRRLPLLLDLMGFLAEQQPETLARHALLFVLQCLPAKALADPALKQQVIDSLHGLPAAFTDRTPQPVALAGAVELTGDQGAAAIVLRLLAGEGQIGRASCRGRV